MEYWSTGVSYKIDPPEANHNPGPDRSPVAYTPESCLENYIAGIQINYCVLQLQLHKARTINWVIAIGPDGIKS